MALIVTPLWGSGAIANEARLTSWPSLFDLLSMDGAEAHLSRLLCPTEGRERARSIARDFSAAWDREKDAIDADALTSLVMLHIARIVDQEPLLGSWLLRVGRTIWPLAVRDADQEDMWSGPLAWFARVDAELPSGPELTHRARTAVRMGLALELPPEIADDFQPATAWDSWIVDRWDEMGMTPLVLADWVLGNSAVRMAWRLLSEQLTRAECYEFIGFLASAESRWQDLHEPPSWPYLDLDW